MNLALLNVCRNVPGHADLACLSSPAEYTYCMAEDATVGLEPLRLPDGTMAGSLEDLRVRR